MCPVNGSWWWLLYAAMVKLHEIAGYPPKTLGSLATMDLTTKHARWSNIGACINHQVNRLRKRLGTLVFFPWIQLEQAWRIRAHGHFCGGKNAHLLYKCRVTSGGFAYHFRAPNPNDSMFQYLFIFQKRNSQRSWNIVDTEQYRSAIQIILYLAPPWIPRVLVLCIEFRRSRRRQTLRCSCTTLMSEQPCVWSSTWPRRTQWLTKKIPQKWASWFFFGQLKILNYVLEPSIIPCKNHLVCHRPLRFERISSHGFPSAGGAADQHPKAPMDQRRWNEGSVGSWMGRRWNVVGVVWKFGTPPLDHDIWHSFFQDFSSYCSQKKGDAFLGSR